MKTPSIGRIVHYVSRGSADGVFPPKHYPAIVTEVAPGDIGTCVLWVLTSYGMHIETAVHDEEQAAGTWHWPEVV